LVNIATRYPGNGRKQAEEKKDKKTSFVTMNSLELAVDSLSF